MKAYKYVGYGKKLEFDELRKPVSRKKEISIVLPTYNEEGNIGRLVRGINKVMSKTKYKNSYEIVIVDDNSSDKTSEMIDKLSKKDKVVALHRYKDKGIFSAVLAGVKIANGKYILNMDSDFNHPPEYILRLLKYKDKYDIVLCSRFVKGGDMPSTFISKYGAIGINRIISNILHLGINDGNGGFHIMKKSDFDRIKFRYEVVFGEFGFELFYRARRLGLKIKEVPFVYRIRDSGESGMGNKLKMSYVYLKRALQLRFE